MKRSDHPGEALALILAAAFCAFTPGLAAQSRDTPPKQGEQQQDQQQNKTFSGKIEKLQNGQYALITGQTPEGKLSGHFLDDPDDAKKYEGKRVTVTGTFDTASNTIHVTNIQAA
jgi:hypothetical protein